VTLAFAAPQLCANPRIIALMAVAHKQDPIVLVIDFHHAR
jgi:hypothetical protein